MLGYVLGLSGIGTIALLSGYYTLKAEAIRDFMLGYSLRQSERKNVLYRAQHAIMSPPYYVTGTRIVCGAVCMFTTGAFALNLFSLFWGLSH